MDRSALDSILSHLDGTDPDVFEHVLDYLRASLRRTTFDAADGMSADGNVALQALAHIEHADFRSAYELLDSVVKANYLSSSLFLALSVTNLKLNYPEAAERYAFQARKLHRLLEDRSHAELLDRYADAVHDAVQEWKDSKLVVNGRHVHRYPTRHQLEQVNAVDKYIMAGLAPKAPLIAKTDRIVTIGSCFAGEISRFLQNNGYDIPLLNSDYSGRLPTASFSEDVFNTFILRYLVELAFDKTAAEGSEYRVISQHNRVTHMSVSAVRETFGSATVFLMTLGLSEVWFDKRTGEVFRTAKSVGEFDPDRHDFRVTTMQENLDNIERVYRVIRGGKPDAIIIFTLSPVPLKATFRAMSCVAANTVSKATLRVAIDELCRRYEGDERLFYFPSYELIKECLPNPFGPDLRHVNRDTVNFVMTLFANHYLVRENSSSA